MQLKDPSSAAVDCGQSSNGSFTISSVDDVVDKQKLDAMYRRISAFLMPTFVLVMILSQVDRHNISYAALTMNRDLHFSTSIYGLGSALFFIPMFVCQVPSNIMMLRVGVPRWLGFIVFCWGVVAACGAAIHNEASFYVLRLLLGVFEAGAAPAMWYAMSQFYPQDRLTRPYMWVTSGILLSSVLGAPLAAAFLSMEGVGGLKGWQWLLLCEGIPTVVLGICVALFLPETPLTSKWLSEEQKELFRRDMLRSQATNPPRQLLSTNPLKLLRPVVTNPLTPLATYVGFAIAVASYTFMFFSTIIVAGLLKGNGGLARVSAAAAAGSMELKPILLLSIPCTVAAVVAWVVAWHSQSRNEVYWHSSICLFISGAMYMAFPPLGSVSVAAGFFAVIAFASAVAAAYAPLLTAITRVFHGPGSGLGLAFYNSIAVLGGFAGPYLTGNLLQRPKGLWLVCFITGSMLMAAAVVVLLLRQLTLRRERQQAANGEGFAADADAAVDAPTASYAKDIEAPHTPLDLKKESGPELSTTRGACKAASPPGTDVLPNAKDVNRGLLPQRS